MGSFNGTEIYELMGIYLLSNLVLIAPVEDVGLYRNGGLILLRNQNEENRQSLCPLFFVKFFFFHQMIALQKL